MDIFYVLEPEEGIRFGTKWAYADLVAPVNRGDCQYCPVCGGGVSGLEWLPPHRIKLSSAKPEKWGDFVWGAGFPLLVSDRFREIYHAEGLSGIAEFSPPVEIVRVGRRKSGDFSVPPPLYHLIHVPWGGANQDDAASELIHELPEKIKCTYCRIGVTWRKQKGVIIEEGSWNGTDIFKPRAAPVSRMVSERFKKIAEAYGFKNIWLIPSEKYGYDERGERLWYVND